MSGSKERQEINNEINEYLYSITNKFGWIAILINVFLLFFIELKLIEENLQAAIIVRITSVLAYISLLVSKRILKEKLIKHIQSIMIGAILLNILPVAYSGALIYNIQNNYFLAIMGILQVEFAFATFIPLQKRNNLIFLILLNSIFLITQLIFTKLSAEDLSNLVTAQGIFFFLAYYLNYTIIKYKTKEFEERQQLKILNKELYEANHKKDKFFSIVSHDLKNPLQSILLTSELLKLNVKKGKLEKIPKYTEQLYKSTHHFNELMNNLFTWSLFQTGEYIYKPETFNINDLFSSAYETYQGIVNKKNLTFSFPQDIESEIYADKNMIKTLIYNLTHNSIKFTPENGNISYNFEKVNSEYLISVSDSGIGMKESTKNQILDNVKADSSLGTDDEEGTGLGLLITKEIIIKHGGKLDIQSEIGQGTTFTISIPIMQN